MQHERKNRWGLRGERVQPSERTTISNLAQISAVRFYMQNFHDSPIRRVLIAELTEVLFYLTISRALLESCHHREASANLLPQRHGTHRGRKHQGYAQQSCASKASL